MCVAPIFVYQQLNTMNLTERFRDRLNNLLSGNLLATVFGALLMAVALYGLVSLLTWFLYRVPGLPGTVQTMAREIGVSTPQLLEFNAIIVTAIFIAVQLWTTHRRAGAAENTAAAAMQTAESTAKTNTAHQFKNAVELLGDQSDIVQIGGVWALSYIARDYPEYQDAVFSIIDSYITQSEVSEP